MMRLRPICAAAALLAAAGATLHAPGARASEAAATRALRAAQSFAGIADPAARSAALFSEAGKVLLHPRCVNCHPAGDVPLQGEDGRPHQPPIRRGAGGHGPAGLHCSACHMTRNFDEAGVPGSASWHLAPAAMAWQGRSLGHVCEQLKDRARNGGRDLSEVVEHVRKDALVGWAWTPGPGREPAPGTQAQFAALMEAWVATGAACPTP